MAAENTRTLIATFNDYSTARQAARELIDSGVPSDAVHVDSNQKTAGAGSGSSYQNEEHHKSGFAEWWNSLFGSDQHNEDRSEYESALSSGSTVLRATVPVNLTDTAVETLNRYGARDVETRSSTQSTTTGDRGPVQVIEEELQVGKRAVQRGGVRVYSHVVTQPVEEQVRLREEHVTVERRKVDREISPAEVSHLRDQTIEVTEMAEEPVVGKRARVREEIVVGKEATDRTETVRDNVRRTEVEVEQLGRESEAATTETMRAEATTDRTEFPTRTGTTPRSGLSPQKPAPGVKSGFGTTAGAGTLAGESTQRSAMRDMGVPDYTPEYRKHFDQTYGSSYEFDTIRPAYEYGYRTASDARYRGRSWDQAESDLRSDYERTYPGSTWERAKNAVRYGWDKVTGRL